MVATTQTFIEFFEKRLDYSDVIKIEKQIRASINNGLVKLEMNVEKTSTAALAKLVSIRGNLIRQGRDLRIQGFRGQAENLRQICRLQEVLPVE